MICAGCDLGSRAVKCVLIEDDKIRNFEIQSYKKHPADAAVDAMESVVKNEGLLANDILYTASTGHGRKIIDFADKAILEVACLKKAILWKFPEVRTIIESGGESIRCYSIGNEGNFSDTAANDKCGSGTGKFIEIMAMAMEISIENFGSHALKAKNPASITSQCGVFAESEIVSLLNEGATVDDVAGGICVSIVKRIAGILKKIDLVEPVIMLGGVAKNEGVVHYLEEALGISLFKHDIDPRIFPALGAALFAREIK